MSGKGAEWVPPEVGLVGRGVGVGGVGVGGGGGGGGGGGCLGQNQYCGHPSLGTPCLIPNSLLALTHLRLRSKSEDEAEVADVAWRGEDGCRCRAAAFAATVNGGWYPTHDEDGGGGRGGGRGGGGGGGGGG
ncbi:hypothetical protein HZH66_000598 [Vespula vulgaris]|uniref:Uncharacterized protein n=1 Tax=Vespula vulgaris TaxID=7454 RepID=A0A834KTE2_VESVU|nr:hypothetical protein HZH66_000598 [Vespula vulgaris]